MHRRSVASRVIALLVAAWFVALSTDLLGLHACPVHDGHPGAGHAPAAPALHHHADGDHHRGSDPADHAHCTCLGACCCAATATLPGSFAAQVRAIVVAGFEAPLITAEAPPA